MELGKMLHSHKKNAPFLAFGKKKRTKKTSTQTDWLMQRRK